jgi:hypothetical protein
VSWQYPIQKHPCLIKDLAGYVKLLGPSLLKLKLSEINNTADTSLHNFSSARRARMVGYIQRAELKTATGEKQSIFLCVDRLPEFDFARIGVGGIFNAPGVPVVAERNDTTIHVGNDSPDLRRRIFASTSDDRREV